VAESEEGGVAALPPIDWVRFYNQVKIWHKNASIFAKKTF